MSLAAQGHTPNVVWDVVERLVIGFADAALALLVGLAVTGAVISNDTYTAHSRSATHHVDFGFPMTAVTQDQFAMTLGAMPQHLTVESPWEYPTDVHPVGLLIDIAVAAMAALLFVLAVVTSVGWVWRHVHLRAPRRATP